MIRFPAPTGAMAGQNLFFSKSDLAYAELRDRILFGTLPAGSRLAQYDLAESLNMSITPLREAIRRLSSEGLVTVDTHRDVRVSVMNSNEARQLFEVRLSLDPTAAELAAQRRTDDDIATMQAAVDKLLPVTRQWGEEALTAHRAFHQALYRASHNDMDGHAAEAAQLMRGHITHSLTATAISALEDREGMRAGQSVGRPASR